MRIVVQPNKRGPGVTAFWQERRFRWLPIYRTTRRELFGDGRQCCLAIAKMAGKVLNERAGGRVPRHIRRQRAREISKAMV